MKNVRALLIMLITIYRASNLAKTIDETKVSWDRRW